METVFQSANAYYAGMLDDVYAAKVSVDLEVYIFQNDKVGQLFLQAMMAAVQRGVKVRFLVDGVGSGIEVHRWLQLLEKAGVDTRIYHPLPWRIWHWPYATQKKEGFEKLRFLLDVVNRRNHRKTLVVDGQIAWVGSFNICRDHLPVKEGGEGWCDSGVRVESVNVEELQQAFNAAWREPTAVKRPMLSGQFRLNYTRYLRKQHVKDLLRHIGQSRERIWICNAYFIPSAKILRALMHAAQRGVDVRLMLPGHSDVVFMPWATSQFYDALLKKGIRIFEYQVSVLHSKTLLVDHWACVGSSNLNHRSLLHDLEADVVLHEPDSVKAVGQQFLHAQVNAKEVKEGESERMGLFKQLLGRFALLMRRWL